MGAHFELESGDHYQWNNHIEAAIKIAQACEVSLDYQAGERINAAFDKRTLKRLQRIESLMENDRSHLLAIDAFLRDANTRKEYAG